MDNQTWENENMKAEKEEIVKSELLELYNVIEWLDFGLVIAIILYVGNAARSAGFTLDYVVSAAQTADFVFFNIFNLPPSIIGLLLCVASLIVSVGAIIVSRLIHKKGANKSRVRLIVRYIVWGIWIPVDLYFLIVYAVGLMG